jgi:hypothetical protein
MKTFRITVYIRSDQLSTVLGLLDGADGVQLVGSITDAADVAPLPPAPPPAVRPLLLPEAPKVAVEVTPTVAKPASRFVNGKKDKGISGEALVEAVLRSGPADLDELRHTFEHRGFAVSSAAPTVSRMLKAGRIRRGMHNRFHLKTDGAGDGLQKSFPLPH